jgi:ATP-binding cassette subfamily C protein LapB
MVQADYREAKDEMFFNPKSSAARVLIPLLDALDWKGDNGKMLEALVDEPNHMDTDGIVETMANLNFKHTRIRNIKGYDLDKRILPVLIVNQKHHFILINLDGENSLIFDGESSTYRKQEISGIRGDLIAFQYANDAGGTLIEPQENWFSKLILRFKRSFINIAILTLLITILDLMLPFFVSLIYDRIMILRDFTPIVLTFIGILIYILSSYSLNQLRSSVMNYISSRIGAIISEQTFTRLVYLSPSYTETASVNSQISRIKDFENIKKFVSSSSFVAIFDLIFSFIYLVAMFYIGGWIAIVPVCTLILLILIGISMRPFHKIQMEKVSESSTEKQQNLLEILRYTDEIKASGSKINWVERTKKITAANIISKFELSDYVNLSNNISYFITNAAALVIVYGGVVQVFTDKMTTGALIGLLMLYWKTAGSIRGAFSLGVQVNGLIKSIAQINRFMKLPQDNNLKTNMVTLKAIKGFVRFNDVSIRYNPISNPALLNVNFVNSPGKILGITGHDGAGKTTILKLILNMYKPQGGRIIIDNVNIQQLEPLFLRRSISYSSEKDMMLSGTIRDNFRSFNPEITDKKIMDIADKTGLSDYFTLYDYNLDTEINEQMIKDFSLSFKKLFNLTRMLVRETKLYLIDEPENHLDRDSLGKILRVIIGLAKEQDASVIISTKDESVLKSCDNVIMLNQGRISENK